MASELSLGCGAIVLCIGLLLTVILVPLSFSYVEYYEYGLAQRKTTGAVDTSKVYARGRYLLGPDYKFLKYQADAHHEHLDALSVFSGGTSNASIGLSFKLDVDFIYFLIQDEVGELHRDLATSYDDIIMSRAREAIKNEAIYVTFEEYFQDRQIVENRFKEAVQNRWDAKPRLHCTLDQFYLSRIQIPESVARKQLESRVQNEKNDREAYFQQAQVEREMTAVEVNSIHLEKERVLRTAEAEANLERAKAKAEAQKITDEAQIKGTKMLFEGTNITSQEHMTSFTYIRNLISHKNLELDVSYIAEDNVIRTKMVG
eukprot:CAMPEP_0183306692 /NCGR_PEP_ID=MMETSP0160_2-20130417/13528_1 /TAXON_ID=2839 ORGANISM="Odontella Sinensis, Strain Grunow 1884" /NCGR_SAMPLE_ID=MMETSP0160_2 /ASSEMBLY_ACC=CAM_ASM_000250 /LENGTH=315 /DNA_ID=CAMNT_0025470133 /DNA_START=15 /DNA_END=962 /DNA_ORIENTATION=+